MLHPLLRIAVWRPQLHRNGAAEMKMPRVAVGRGAFCWAGLSWTMLTRAGGWAGWPGRGWVLLFVEGKWKFVDDAADRDAQDHVVAVAFALEPGGAGDLLVGENHGFLQRHFVHLGMGIEFRLVFAYELDGGLVFGQVILCVGRGGKVASGSRQISAGAGCGVGGGPENLVAGGCPQFVGILIGERFLFQAEIGELDVRGDYVDALEAAVGDGNIGEQFPAGVLKRNLHGYAVYGEGLDQRAFGVEALRAGSAGDPAGYAVVDCRGRDGFLRLRDRVLADVHPRHVATFAFGGSDVDGVALAGGEKRDLLAAIESGDQPERQRLLGVGGHRDV